MEPNGGNKCDSILVGSSRRGQLKGPIYTAAITSFWWTKKEKKKDHGFHHASWRCTRVERNLLNWDKKPTDAADLDLKKKSLIIDNYRLTSRIGHGNHRPYCSRGRKRAKCLNYIMDGASLRPLPITIISLINQCLLSFFFFFPRQQLSDLLVFFPCERTTFYR